MVLTIDTSNKTVKVEESVKVKELYEFLDKLEDGDEYTIFKQDEVDWLKNWGKDKIVDTYPKKYPNQPDIMYVSSPTAITTEEG